MASTLRVKPVRKHLGWSAARSSSGSHGSFVSGFAGNRNPVIDKCFDRNIHVTVIKRRGISRRIGTADVVCRQNVFKQSKVGNSLFFFPVNFVSKETESTREGHD